MARSKSRKPSFADEAERILMLPVEHRVNSLGGYGPAGEVIYEKHPVACPTVLAEGDGNASLSFMSNGSVGFTVTLDDGMEVRVLDDSFETVEKREVNVPSANVWIGVTSGRRRLVASLMNPRCNQGLEPQTIKVVKLGDPNRAMWFCASFRAGRGIAFDTVTRLGYVRTSKGPALTRRVYVRNRSAKKLSADLWTCFNLHGTQRFVYNKELWYDMGLPVTGLDTVVSATVPYSEVMQIKRISSATGNARAAGATCDYTSFIGDSSATAFLPEAVLKGGILDEGAGGRLNRFSTATVAANRFDCELGSGDSATVDQMLLYVDDKRLIERFRKAVSYKAPEYPAMARAFDKASRMLIKSTPDVRRVVSGGGGKAKASPFFEFSSPAERAVSHYASSVWTGIKQLYEVCRAHGAKLADGIEIGTRDRGQDMWPKMKEDPGRVRSDLVHAFSFMYITTDKDLSRVKSLSLRQKLHGMFPRQFPSRWLDRSQEVMNDNRPYTDSPLWLINSLCMYIRETGDAGILLEEVESVRLTNPDNPVESGIVGCDRKFRILDVVFEIFACFERHAKDTPYGMAQILYGDWCDPIDMFGTSEIGNPQTRGHGKGVQVRLSAHLFLTLIKTIDMLEGGRVRKVVSRLKPGPKIEQLKKFASRLRGNIVKWGWEDGPRNFMAGFLDCIHELRKDGSKPAYSRAETGYTLGSMKKRDFDGLNRRQLASQAWGLAMLNTDRPFLKPLKGRDAMVDRLLHTTDKLFARPKLGLTMLSTPIANNQQAVDMVGRMGVVPPGVAENGEYHHCQVFMHYFRLFIPGQVDTVWKQFRYILSASRDESIGGPFDMPSNSYTSDPKDPHFGKGMYFGLSGSMDWMIEIYSRIAGVELSLTDDEGPDLRIEPDLPKALKGALTFRRVIHLAQPEGGYRRIPLTVNIDTKGSGRLKDTIIKVNGKRMEEAVVPNLGDVRKVNVQVTFVRG